MVETGLDDVSVLAVTQNKEIINDSPQRYFLKKVKVCFENVRRRKYKYSS